MFFHGLNLTSPIDASIIITAIPIVAVVFGFILLKEKITKFREDELHHKDIAYKEGATKKGIYSILDKIIKTGSKIAINISEKI